MNCFEFKKYMDDFIEGSIDDSLKIEMQNHINICSPCRNEYEDTKFIVDSLRKDASSIILNDRQRKEIKETILKAPVKKYKNFNSLVRNMTYAAAIFMFITAGIYFSGGVKINIGSAEENNLFQTRIEFLESENSRLNVEKLTLENQNRQLRTLVNDLESGKYRNWMMINSTIGEAVIEGRIISVNADKKTIKLEVYKDDNTPDIDPNIIIPEGIMISKVSEGAGKDEYAPVSGSIKDLKVNDHITIHYLSSSKSARALILFE